MFATHLRRTLSFAAAFLALVTVASAQSAATLRIRLIDGKSGKALTPASIRVATTPDEKPRYLIPAADPASVLVYLKSATSFTVSDQFKRCDVPKQDAPAAQYSVYDILSHGQVSANSCASAKSKLTPLAPKSGELVLYVRHATPCELSKDHINGINFCK